MLWYTWIYFEIDILTDKQNITKKYFKVQAFMKKATKIGY